MYPLSPSNIQKAFARIDQKTGTRIYGAILSRNPFKEITLEKTSQEARNVTWFHTNPLKSYTASSNMSGAGRILYADGKQHIMSGKEQASYNATFDRIAYNINKIATAPAEKSVKMIIKKEIDSFYAKVYKGIKPYNNGEVVAKIKALIKGDGDKKSKLDAAKDIFMEEMGYDPQLIKIKIKDKVDGGVAGFDNIRGGIIFAKGLINDSSIEELIAILRHELDHFDKAAKLCKAIGIEKFKKLNFDVPEAVLKKSNETSQAFNSEFYTKAVKQAKCDDFETRKYINACYKYFRRTQYDGSVYSELLSRQEYYANPLEISANMVQHSLEKSLNVTVPSIGREYLLKNIMASFEELIHRQPELAKYKSEIFDYLLAKSKNLIQETIKTPYKKIEGDLSFRLSDELETIILLKFLKLLKEPISQEEIIEILEDMTSKYSSALRYMFVSESSKPIIKKKYLEVNKKLLEYLEHNKMDDRMLEFPKLQLMLQQIVVDKDITSLGSIGENLEELGVSQELLDKIYSNQCFIKWHKRCPDLSREAYLLQKLKEQV